MIFMFNFTIILCFMSTRLIWNRIIKIRPALYIYGYSVSPGYLHWNQPAHPQQALVGKIKLQMWIKWYLTRLGSSLKAFASTCGHTGYWRQIINKRPMGQAQPAECCVWPAVSFLPPLFSVRSDCSQLLGPVFPSSGTDTTAPSCPRGSLQFSCRPSVHF